MSLSDYLRTAEAAKLLGVSAGTIRNCEKHGKLRARRLPQNDSRLFVKKDLEVVLLNVECADAASEAPERQTARKRA
jgi:excisionase family DNA binding protein